MRLELRAALVAALLANAGCATIFTGTTDVLTFDASVPGVRLSVDGQYLGQLPLTYTMSRNFVGGRQFIAKFEKAGYQTQEFQLAREFNPTAVLDITSLPTAGGIDVLTGALMRFAPREYHVVMLEAGASARTEAFQRSLRIRQYALGSFRRVQADLARGGGEHLDALVQAIAAGDLEASARVREGALRSAPALAAAATAPDFLARLDRMLAEDPALDAFRI